MIIKDLVNSIKFVGKLYEIEKYVESFHYTYKSKSRLIVNDIENIYSCVAVGVKIDDITRKYEDERLNDLLVDCYNFLRANFQEKNLYRVLKEIREDIDHPRLSVDIIHLFEVAKFAIFTKTFDTSDELEIIHILNSTFKNIVDSSSINDIFITSSFDKYKHANLLREANTMLRSNFSIGYDQVMKMWSEGKQFDLLCYIYRNSESIQNCSAIIKHIIDAGYSDTSFIVLNEDSHSEHDKHDSVSLDSSIFTPLSEFDDIYNNVTILPEFYYSMGTGYYVDIANGLTREYAKVKSEDIVDKAFSSESSLVELLTRTSTYNETCSSYYAFLNKFFKSKFDNTKGNNTTRFITLAVEFLLRCYNFRLEAGLLDEDAIDIYRSNCKESMLKDSTEDIGKSNDDSYYTSLLSNGLVGSDLSEDQIKVLLDEILYAVVVYSDKYSDFTQEDILSFYCEYCESYADHTSNDDQATYLINKIITNNGISDVSKNHSVDKDSVVYERYVALLDNGHEELIPDDECKQLNELIKSIDVSLPVLSIDDVRRIFLSYVGSDGGDVSEFSKYFSTMDEDALKSELSIISMCIGCIYDFTECFDQENTINLYSDYKESVGSTSFASTLLMFMQQVVELNSDKFETSGVFDANIDIIELCSEICAIDLTISNYVSDFVEEKMVPISDSTIMLIEKNIVEKVAPIEDIITSNIPKLCNYKDDLVDVISNVICACKNLWKDDQWVLVEDDITDSLNSAGVDISANEYLYNIVMYFIDKVTDLDKLFDDDYLSTYLTKYDELYPSTSTEGVVDNDTSVNEESDSSNKESESTEDSAETKDKSNKLNKEEIKMKYTNEFIDACRYAISVVAERNDCEAFEVDRDKVYDFVCDLEDDGKFDPDDFEYSPSDVQNVMDMFEDIDEVVDGLDKSQFEDSDEDTESSSD